MKSVLFISKSEHAPSTRYRALNYFVLLRAAGWEPLHITVTRNPLDQIKCLKLARKVDVVVVVRRRFDGLFGILLRRMAKHLVFDFDDAIYLHHGNLKKQKRRRKFESFLPKCNQVWAGNNHLAEYARPHCKAVHVIPTSINVAKYKQTHHKPTATVDLVWIGTQSTRSYLENIMPEIEDAAKYIPNLRLKIIANFTLQSSILNIHPVQWHQDTEVTELVTSHIGLAPLTDDPWTKGKCGLKVLQYMASALPVITSDAGVNREMVRHNETGLIVNDSLSWSNAIVQLAQAPDHHLKTMGEAGHAIALKQYDIHHMAEHIIQLMQQSTS